MFTIMSDAEKPLIGQPEDEFAAKAEGFVLALERFINEGNAFATLENANTTCTSSSSNNLTAGDRTFTVPAGLGYASGMPCRAAVTGSSTQYADAIVKSYSGTTLVLTFGTPVGSGSGITTWTITKANTSANVATLVANIFTGVQNFAQGANIAAASTINLDTATGNCVDLTGNTTINAATLTNGRIRYGIITGTPILNYHATNLKLNTGGNPYQCVGNELYIAFARSGVVIFLVFKADGTPITGLPPALPLIDIGGWSIPGTTPIKLDAGQAVTDSKTGAIFIAVRFTNAASGIETVYDQVGSRLQLARSASGNITLQGKNAAGTTILDVSTSGNPCALAGLYFIQTSWDLATPGSGRLYVNNTSNYVETTYTNDTIDHPSAGAGAFLFGSSAGASNFLTGNIYTPWVDLVNYVDFSVASVRGKFLTQDLVPLFIGKRGELPTGNIPSIFFIANKGMDSFYVGNNEGNVSLITPSTLCAFRTVALLGQYAEALDDRKGRNISSKIPGTTEGSANVPVQIPWIAAGFSSSALSYYLLAGTKYSFKIVAEYDAAATTTGCRFTPSYSGSVSKIAYKSVYPLTATSETVNYGNAILQPAACNASSLLTGNTAIIEGIIETNSAGLFSALVASEVAASNITVQQAYMEITRLD